MIKLFRRIRQNLLSENPADRNRSLHTGKFSKYLLYAIGEIVLVVIGILLALQINNWNEQNKLDKKSKKLFREMYEEYAETGRILESAYEGNELYVSFLKNTIENWHHLDLETVNKFPRSEFQKSYFSILFLLSSYSQFNDPKNDIFNKSIADGSISLVDKDFVANISVTYRLIPRLNEMIEQEYDISKEINAHIAKTYNSILVNLERLDEHKIETSTTDKLLKSFRNDGTLKYLLNTRMEFAKSRSIILMLRSKEIRETLEKFAPGVK